MTDCKHLDAKDKSYNNNDIFDHPSYDYTCKKSGKSVIPCIVCNPQRCKNYVEKDDNHD